LVVIERSVSALRLTARIGRPGTFVDSLSMMSWLSPLKIAARVSTTRGTGPAAWPKSSDTSPPPMRLEAGHAASPEAMSWASDAVQRGRASVSIRAPAYSNWTRRWTECGFWPLSFESR
jgi:hypothetical protein